MTCVVLLLSVTRMAVEKRDNTRQGSTRDGFSAGEHGFHSEGEVGRMVY